MQMILNNIFNKRNRTAFNEFLDQLISNSSVLEILGLSDKDFINATQEELMNNPDDIGSGVIGVQINSGMKYFGIFQNLIIKHYDSGDVKYMFYTETNDKLKILGIAANIIDKLGTGNFDDRKHYSFLNQGEVERLADSLGEPIDKDIVHVWLHEETSIVLQYRNEPLKQFVFSINIGAKVENDLSARNQGSIHDLLKFDINRLLLEGIEIERYKEIEDDEIKFIDYRYQLPIKELKVFDLIDIRIFSEKMFVNSSIQTHISLFSSNDISIHEMVEVVDELISIYGSDDSGSREIEAYEVEMLSNREFWVGRNWTFNQYHGLWDHSKFNDEIFYIVSVSNDPSNNGFCLHVSSYEKLLS